MEGDELRVRDLFFVLLYSLINTLKRGNLPFDKVFESPPPPPTTLIFGKILKFSDAPKITTLGLITVT